MSNFTQAVDTKLNYPDTCHIYKIHRKYAPMMVPTLCRV